MNTKIREEIGPIARLEALFIVQKLPKTRSGKILRGTIRKISNGQEYKMPATIDDVANIKEIEEVSGEWVKKRLEDMKKQHEEELNKLNK